MSEEYKKPRLFAEDEAALPLHVFMIRDMAIPKYGNRFRESRTVRAKKYDCFQFYKHISRPLPLNAGEGDEND